VRSSKLAVEASAKDVSMKPLKITTWILGLFFLASFLQWLVSPGTAAEGLGMPLLTGAGRSTQIADMSIFFLAIGAMSLLGTRPGQSHWLYGAAGMLGGAGVMRILAYLLHDAAFAAPFILVEFVCAALLVAAGRRLADA
jgi:hypothetical protein